MLSRDRHWMQDLRSEQLLALPGRHLLTPTLSLTALFPSTLFISLVYLPTICNYLGLLPCLWIVPTPEWQLFEKGNELCPGHYDALLPIRLAQRSCALCAEGVND